jgi:predicted TIM-barrel fold metal-dependent hydrolase
MNFAVGIIRSNQDLLSLLVYGGVFERHPLLRVVCVEADASWAPHWMHRMDHYYDRHRYMRTLELSRLPSEYFREHVYLTFQDDWPAFRMTGLLNPRRLMWANDFPHSDSTWPWSRELLDRHAADVSEAELRLILHDNVAALYGMPEPQ